MLFLQKERERLKAELDDTETLQRRALASTQLVGRLVKLASEMRELWQVATVAEKKEFLSLMVESISIEPVDTLAAFAISYCLGEGLGRLACISFGCCYGRHLSELGPRMERFFGRISFTFYGECKKAVYASRLCGVKVFPIQAVTALIYLAASLAGIILFLEGRFAVSLIIVSLVTHAWRISSEFLRADYRGRQMAGLLSSYQVMGIGAIAVSVLYAALLPGGAIPSGSITLGFHHIVNLEFLLLVQFLWKLSFYHFGKSTVTGSTVELFVNKENA